MPRRKRIVEEVPVIDGPEFECRLLDLNEFQTLRINSEESGDETRLARYHGSNFWSIKGFGVSRWVIGGYIVIDWKQLMQEGNSVEDIYRGCVKFLNKPPVRRKFQKRITKPLFGILQTAMDKCLFFLIFLKTLYKFFAASFRLPFLDKK